MISKAKTDSGDHIAWDTKLSGFGLRTRDGRRSYVVQYRLGAQQRRVTLGSVEKLTLKQAQVEAKKIFGKVAQGIDPQAEKKEALAKASATDTFIAIANRFIEYQAGTDARTGKPRLRPSSLYSTELYLLKRAKRLHGLHIDALNLRLVAEVLSDIAKHSGAVSADRARSAMSSMFGWAISEGLCETNPVEYATVRGTAKRDRVLKPEEIAAIWSALPANDYGSIVKLLFYTGCRSDEIAGLLWSEIDLDDCAVNFGSERIKNKLPFYLPLSDAAVRLVKSIERKDGRDLVFGKRDGAFTGWSKAKRELDAKLNFKEPWQLRDIRRTVATLMAESGTDPHIVEACLNHVSGYKAGVAGVYNRAAYAEPKREALSKWAKEIATILLPNRAKHHG